MTLQNTGAVQAAAAAAGSDESTEASDNEEVRGVDLMHSLPDAREASNISLFSPSCSRSQ